MSETDNLPYISVGVSEYDPDETDNLINCINEVLNQEYPKFEIVVVSESEDVSDDVRMHFSSNDVVQIIDIDNSDGGLSRARNIAAQRARGEVIAYIDSDAIPSDDWLYQIGSTYRDEDVIAVGGKAEAKWIGSRPAYLSDEFLWLVGVTHKGHPEHGSIVRSSFGCNISYKSQVLDELNFNENLGKSQGYNLQGEEAELGIRIQKEFGTGMYYNENAVVHHKVDMEQTTFRWLCRRAYLQGVSKAVISRTTSSDGLNEDTDFLKSIVTSSVPEYILLFLTSLNYRHLLSLFGVLYFTFLVGVGFVVGSLKSVGRRH